MFRPQGKSSPLDGLPIDLRVLMHLWVCGTRHDCRLPLIDVGGLYNSS